MKVQFLYFEGCPHHQKSFQMLQAILEELGITASLTRVEVKNNRDAVKHKFIGSPTIRIDGLDIDRAKGKPIYARTCRIYRVNGKLTGLPSQRMIEDAIRAAANRAAQSVHYGSPPQQPS